MKNNKAAQKLNIDLYLFILSPIVFLSGVLLYVASLVSGAGWLDHDVWMNIHTFSSLPLYYLFIKHIADHWAWYKGGWQKRKQGENRYGCSPYLSRFPP